LYAPPPPTRAVKVALVVKVTAKEAPAPPALSEAVLPLAPPPPVRVTVKVHGGAAPR
jgi:hypothetical protein